MNATTVYLDGRPVRLEPRRVIGSGGEADVYALDDRRVLKVYKGPRHPDHASSAAQRKAARDRIRIQQRKLVSFPRRLPGAVVAPGALCTEQSDGGRILGFAMARVNDAEPISTLAEPGSRLKGIGAGDVVAVLRGLHGTLTALHRAGVVVGDLNDENILLRPRGATAEHALIDADSFQFGPFLTSVFTERFVDPLLCDADAPRPTLVRPHGASSDWYAFTVLVMRSLLFVGPYGGVFRPSAPAERRPEPRRPLERITVFDARVRYPRPALPYQVLSDALLDHLCQVFERDRRGPFPLGLLDDLRWQRCTGCGREHARRRCPSCTPLVAVPAARCAPVHEVVGGLDARLVASFDGPLLAARVAPDGRTLWWLRHDGDGYRREDGALVLAGPLDPGLSFELGGDRTLVTRGRDLVILGRDGTVVRRAVASCAGRPAVATDGQRVILVVGERLVRERLGGSALLGDEPIAEVLGDQTRMWAGPRFGLGLTRAGTITMCFVFSTTRGAGIKDVALPRYAGTLRDVSAVVGAERAWLVASLVRDGRLERRADLVAAAGEHLGAVTDDDPNGSWLASVAGAVAVGSALLVPTDEGVVRVEPRGPSLEVTHRFPETARHVDAATRLLATRDGLCAVQARHLWLLRLAAAHPTAGVSAAG